MITVRLRSDEAGVPPFVVSIPAGIKMQWTDGVMAVVDAYGEEIAWFPINHVAWGKKEEPVKQEVRGGK